MRELTGWARLPTVMNDATHPRPLLMASAAIYRIRVQGTLDARLVSQLDGLNLSEEGRNLDPPVSVLVGRIIDQASLSGLLNTLYGMHLPLLSVNCIDVEESP
jgi:hypothetical protein